MLALAVTSQCGIWLSNPIMSRGGYACEVGLTRPGTATSISYGYWGILYKKRTKYQKSFGHFHQGRKTKHLFEPFAKRQIPQRKSGNTHQISSHPDFKIPKTKQQGIKYAITAYAVHARKWPSVCTQRRIKSYDKLQTQLPGGH